MKPKSLINLILIFLNCNNLYSKFYCLNSKNKIVAIDDQIFKEMNSSPVNTPGTTIYNNILIIGCGAVAQCLLPILVKELNIKPNQITILDFVDNKYKITDLIEQGLIYKQIKITKENYKDILKNNLNPGDILIDLSWYIGTIDLLKWCYENNIRYLNTSIELWDISQNMKDKDIQNFTLYARHMAIKDLLLSWGNNNGPTAILDHGANPGLVSHFTKQAIEDIAYKIILEKPTDYRINEIKLALNSKNFAKLAQLEGIKVIHISEKDTQISLIPKKPNEFVNTWSIPGLYEEATAPAELGWGTHEKKLPKGIIFHKTGPKNQVCLESQGLDTIVRSWVPSGEILGMVIRHGEAFSISDRLTVWENQKAIYRPTVNYAYCICDAALSSLYELKMRQFEIQENIRIMSNDILQGEDELGVLLMGHDYNAWWIGSILDIKEARKLVPNQNATTVQVAISAVAAIKYMINHPNNGVCLPDDLDHKEILDFAKPYLGKFLSISTDWTPLKRKASYFSYNKNIINPKDIWQFTTFLVNNCNY
jgi:homospermidine synthase